MPPAPPPSGTVTAVFDVTGTSDTPTLPQLHGGYYQWWVRALDGSGDVGPQKGENFFRIPPLQISPASGTPVSTYQPQFQWNDVTDTSSNQITSYELKLIDASTNLTLSDDYLPQGTTSYKSTFPLRNGGSYTWSVVSITRTTNIYGRGGTGVLITDTKTADSPIAFTVSVKNGGTGYLPTPTASSPSGGLSTAKPTFTWSTVAGAAGYAVYIEDLNAPPETTFLPQLVPAPVLPATTASYTPGSPLLANESYLWWVIAYDTSGDVSLRSPTLAFKTASQPLGSIAAPANLSPTGTLKLTSTTTSLSWSSVSGASSYLVSLVNLTTGIPLLNNVSISGATSDTSPSLTNGDTYEWFVSSSGATGVSQAASASFTVQTSSIASPYPIYPVDNVTVNTLQPLLTWTSVYNASLYLVFLTDETAGVSLDPSGIPEMITSYTPTTPLISGHLYQWSVEAAAVVNGQEVTGPPSLQEDFVVVYPDTPNTNPFNGPVNTTTPDFTWQPSAGATYYRITVVEHHKQHHPDQRRRGNDHLVHTGDPAAQRRYVPVVCPGLRQLRRC